jgi:putative membrane protein
MKENDMELLYQASERVGSIGQMGRLGELLTQGGPYDWGWGTHPMMWGAWGFGMMIMMILFWVLIIVAVILGIRWLLGQGKVSRSDTAVEILRQRYARGEINKEEFDVKKKDLEG